MRRYRKERDSQAPCEGAEEPWGPIISLGKPLSANRGGYLQRLMSRSRLAAKQFLTINMTLDLTLVRRSADTLGLAEIASTCDAQLLIVDQGSEQIDAWGGRKPITGGKGVWPDGLP